MKARREEEAIIADGPREGLAGVAAEQFRVLAKAASGLMKEHSWLEFELRRVLNLAQSAPCLKRKAEKLVCCRMK